MSSKPNLSAADTRYLVDVDGHDHVALVAALRGGGMATLGPEPAGESTPSAGPGGETETIVAVARFVRTRVDPQTAEFAIVVGDALQRQGLGTELMSRLAAAAAHRGILRFRATIFADNLAIHRLMEGVGSGELRCRRLGTISELDIDLAAGGADRRAVGVPGAWAGS